MDPAGAPEGENAGSSGLVVMLLDNHYAPDRRVEYEVDLLRDAGLDVRIVAWDRRNIREPEDDAPPPGVVRIRFPAPPGGGLRSLVAMIRFARVVWKRRHELLRNAQLLIVHDIYLLPLGRSLSTAASIPFVYDAHEEYARMEAARYPDWFLQVATKTENALARRAAFIVVPGITRTPRWSRAGFERVLVLRNTGLGNARRIADVDLEWDILYIGILESQRRLDLLLELARTRPDIRVAIAGAGRLASEIEREASLLPNVSYLGWQNEVSHVVARARALYYGLDPEHPDAETACPNTLYLALSHRRPLVYFGGGEISEVAREFRIGMQVAVSAEGIARGVDEVRQTSTWDFEAAWASVASAEERRAYVTAVARAAGHDAGDHTLDAGQSGMAR